MYEQDMTPQTAREKKSISMSANVSGNDGGHYNKSTIPAGAFSSPLLRTKVLSHGNLNSPMMPVFAKRLTEQHKSSRLHGEKGIAANGYRQFVTEQAELRETRIRNLAAGMEERDKIEGDVGNDDLGGMKTRKKIEDNGDSIYKTEGINVRQVIMALNEDNMEYLKSNFDKEKKGLLTGPQVGFEELAIPI